jgi:hypothetical protein
MSVTGWSKRSQLQGAREIDERRRTLVVRWSEAIERNDADESFSTACLPLNDITVYDILAPVSNEQHCAKENYYGRSHSKSAAKWSV